MGPLGGGSHVSTAGGLLAVILRFDGEFAAPLSIHKMYGSVPTSAISLVSNTCYCDGDRFDDRR